MKPYIRVAQIMTFSFLLGFTSLVYAQDVFAPVPPVNPSAQPMTTQQPVQTTHPQQAKSKSTTSRHKVHKKRANSNQKQYYTRKKQQRKRTGSLDIKLHNVL